MSTRSNALPPSAPTIDRVGRPGSEIRRDQEVAAVAANLRRIRKERGVTQVELAAKLGVPQQMVSDYERGKLRLHAQAIIKVARLLGTSADQLLGLEKPRSAAASVESTKFLKRLRRMEQLSRRDQQALLRTIDAFLGNAELKKSA